MKFKQFLLEEATGFVEKFKALYSFIDVAKRQTLVKEALEQLEIAVSAEQVFNADFNEFREPLARAIELSLSALERGVTAEFKDSYWGVKRENYDLSTYVNFNEANKQVRELKKEITKNPACKEIFQNMLAVNEAAAEINALLKALKPKIVKGRRPSNKPVDPNAFHQKMGSKEAQEVVLNAVKKEISEKLDTYQVGVEKWLQSVFDKIKAMTSSSEKLDDITAFVLQQAFNFTRERDPKTGTYSIEDIKVRKADFPKTEAQEQRKGLEDRFLYKNLTKLSHIVELKGNLKEIKPVASRPVEVRAGSGTLEAGFRFSFNDNSEFTVVNKIVTKYSFRGKPFEQFPTTFHDVKMPDGSKMSSPSEEKMVREFCKVKP